MRTLILSDEQASKLIMYLLITTNYREKERDTWKELAQEVEADGNPTIKVAESNATWWSEVCQIMDDIKVLLDETRK